MSILSQKSYSSEIFIAAQTKEYTVYKVEENGNGGTMTSYPVFPGVEVIYNDFNMGQCFYNKNPNTNIMEINHCYQGRFECAFENGSYAYLAKGDLSLNMLSNGTASSCFPLEHYYGVSIVIDISKASDSISSVLKDISIDLYQLRDRLCHNNSCFIMRATNSIEHIFSELYTVPEPIKLGYIKLKVLELLLFLSIIDVSKYSEVRNYFPKKHVEIVKKMKDYMIENIEQHHTLNELSAHFKLPLTTMKLCFKGIYGTSIYAFMRVHRIQSAAVLLRESNESIAQVAGKIGYVNPSKFASAFKDIIGLSPLEYRRMHNNIKELTEEGKKEEEQSIDIRSLYA